MTQDTHFSLITHTKQLLLVIFCCTTAGIGASFWTHGQTDGRTAEEAAAAEGQTDVEVEIVIQIKKFLTLYSGRHSDNPVDRS